MVVLWDKWQGPLIFLILPGVIFDSVRISATTLHTYYCAYLANNDFDEGPIPSVWELENLEELSLRAAQMVGTIPTEIGQMLNLSLLDLGHNGLDGKPPEEIGDMESLRFLLLDQNLFTGTLTRGFKKLTGLGMCFLLLRLPRHLSDLTNLSSSLIQSCFYWTTTTL